MSWRTAPTCPAFVKNSPPVFMFLAIGGVRTATGMSDIQNLIQEMMITFYILGEYKL